MVHPSKDITGKEGQELKGKRIVLGVTGSVSAYRAADIARDLMRHGADVHAVMTSGAQKIIHPNLLEWATGNPVVTELTGKIEHVAFTTGKEKADLILVAPVTANTIGKIASGIDDTTVTSYVSSALGAGIPIVIAPAMHDTMLTHPIIEENLKKLERAGITLVPPVIEEGKAKLSSPKVILEIAISRLAKKNDMSGMKVLITGGPTVEPIDPVRILTNRSSGKMAVALASACIRRGAEVVMVYGPGVAEPPSSARVVRVETARQMLAAVEKELSSKRFDLAIAAAAASDYGPARYHNEKLDSKREDVVLELRRSPKIIERVKELSPSTFLLIFKAEHSVTRVEMVSRAAKRGREVRADLVAANDVGREGVGFGSEDNEVVLVDPRGKSVSLPKARKSAIADRLLDSVVARIRT
ncbi:MAG: bifunctional phosphopantothenoylcysteine decarboxylase/phosphopantothenate--cysteine ligase CoaBC [Nitrososphaerota archaeon]|nr:bifunctional phosphopantothenoylcysteine decarboxylase/phosphopantothenate--cysteine ligase CoaBC [Nitrososphaerota archaeon]MDG6980605.1 bifunctional phosphopantothenoylcysteine decarboxylase/phosphopantothenate--cysteine ligase CoaBC [Nitrososphaerota archaeon]MDG6983662.1 bifunctional phosphopantothenoylcysteine decarboxylase/phosphopantothenate--cysteine ligase CoaBC [Nitrososphaerota archaeon]